MSRVIRKMKKKHKYSIVAYDMFIEQIESMLLRSITPFTDIGEFSTMFLTRYSKSMEALRLLLINGYEEDSQAHMRNLLEQAITYLYVSLKPEERIELYNDYRFVDSYKLMKKLEKYRPYVDYDFDKEEIISNYERVKDRYKSLNRWSDKNLREMAIEVGNQTEDWYEFIYSMNSSYVHGDYYSLKEIVEQEEYGTITLNIGAKDFNALDIFARVLQFTYFLLLEVCRVNIIENNEITEKWKNAMRLIIDESDVENDEGD
jgi:hypothetical protein